MARTLIASDNFNRANEDPLAGNWLALYTIGGVRLKLTSNHFVSSHAFGLEKTARWNGTGTFSDDQYSSIVIGNIANWGAENMVGVICRASADVDSATNTARDYYYAYMADIGATNTYVGKLVNGTNTVLGSGNVTGWASGDRLDLEVVGTTLTMFRNGTALGGVFTLTGETSLTTGKPGILADGDELITGDDWEGGNITAPPAASFMPFSPFTHLPHLRH